MLSKNQIKILRGLQRKKERKNSGLYIVEGKKIVQEILDSKDDWVELYATKSWLEQYPEYVALENVFEITDKDLAQISSFKTPNDVMLLLKQKAEIEELYTDVTASIRYAKRLQDSILPPEKFIKKLFPSSFVFFKPKDIVSGDFYWIGQQKDEYMFAAVDCTGHGVPGAFMSLVGANGLDSAFTSNKTPSPGLMLDDLNKYANNSLNKSIDDSIRDGMDITLCALNFKKMKLKYMNSYPYV